MKQQDNEQTCPLTDAKLIDKARGIVSQLCKTGGMSWTMRSPVDPTNDSDVILSEIINRFAAMTNSPGNIISRLQHHFQTTTNEYRRERMKEIQERRKADASDGFVTLFKGVAIGPSIPATTGMGYIMDILPPPVPAIGIDGDEYPDDFEKRYAEKKDYYGETVAAICFAADEYGRATAAFAWDQACTYIMGQISAVLTYWADHEPPGTADVLRVALRRLQDTVSRVNPYQDKAQAPDPPDGQIKEHPDDDGMKHEEKKS